MIKKKLKMLFFEAENAKNIYLLTLGQKNAKKLHIFYMFLCILYPKKWFNF